MSKPMSNRKTKRLNGTSALVAVWVPTNILEQLDRLAAEQDTDRSKLIRRAIRSNLAKTRLITP